MGFKASINVYNSKKESSKLVKFLLNSNSNKFAMYKV